ncbi:CD37L protein, partial [Centropus bengalensis]|nr:CD37L protein [Centropus bengalensis]
SQTYSQGIELACQKESEFVKHSVECTWNLAEAQQKLGSLALHNSESCDQESAQAKAEAAELRWREEEWRRKEEALNQRERQNLWNTDPVSKEVFNKSFINQKEIEDEDVSEPLIQKHEQKIRHFGESAFPSILQFGVLLDFAPCWAVWALQATSYMPCFWIPLPWFPSSLCEIVLLKTAKQNSSRYFLFRYYFARISISLGYFEAFKNELEAFKTRVRVWSQSHGFQTMLLHDLSINPGLAGQLTSFSQLTVFHLLQNTGDLQGLTNTDACSLNSVIQRDEEESKMMDTV